MGAGGSAILRDGCGLRKRCDGRKWPKRAKLGAGQRVGRVELLVPGDFV